MASRKPSARVRGERHPTCQPGCKQCYISMASECCPSTAQLHSSLVPWPIWLAAVVILQDLRTSLSLQRPVCIT